ncbi:MAG TPA: DUF6056 family protein, partial [Pyrinomonadaceae bacterium]|nr:DUF6056 family protein [Pyrinomonadaceae bacterium]
MWRRTLLLFLLALFSIPLATHIYLGSYSRLVADDFCSGAVANSHGIVGGAIYWYMNWTGRFAANFLDTLLAPIYPRTIPYQTAVAVIIWFATLAFTVYQILRDDEREVRVLLSCLMALMVLFTLFEVLPSIGQTLYWAQVRSGVPSLILGTAYVALIVRRRSASTHNKRWLLAAALLTFIAAGFAETYSAVQALALVIALAIWLISNRYTAQEKRNSVLPLVAGLVGSVAGALLVVFAPGNYYRRFPFPPHPNPLDVLAISLRGLRDFFYLVVFSPTRAPVWVGLILCGFIFGLGIFRRHEGSVPESKHLVPALLWLPPVTFVLLLACWVPMAWGTSLPLANRTFIIPAYLLVCLVVCWAYLAGRLCRRSYHSFAPHLRMVATALPILTFVVFGLLAVSRSWQLLHQLRPSLAAYARESVARDQLIQSAKSQGLHYVVVPRLTHWTGLDEIEPDP